MKKLTPLLFALSLALAALAGADQPTKACSLLCIQGYHCCVTGNNEQCVPDSQPCP
jgi:hypothetical protein